jgi:hypothetical protein
MPLTKKQRDLVNYLVSYIREHRYSPSYREIAEHFGYRSLATVHEHVGKLAAKGLLRVHAGQRRSIEVLSTDDREPGYVPVFAPTEWLRERCDAYPASPLPAGMEVPLALTRRYREQWKTIRGRLCGGDELWTFRTPEESWLHLAGRAGYAVVREGRVVDGILVHDQMVRPESEARRA